MRFLLVLSLTVSTASLALSLYLYWRLRRVSRASGQGHFQQAVANAAHAETLRLTQQEVRMLREDLRRLHLTAEPAPPGSSRLRIFRLNIDDDF